MVKVKIDCDDCCTWYISEGIWTYEQSEASILTVGEARAVVASLTRASAKYAYIVVVS
jgi:hypothetical protein